MFYRKDMIEKAGFAEADMQNITWDRYIEIGKKLGRCRYRQDAGV